MVVTIDYLIARGRHALGIMQAKRTADRSNGGDRTEHRRRQAVEPQGDTEDSDDSDDDDESVNDSVYLIPYLKKHSKHDKMRWNNDGAAAAAKTTNLEASSSTLSTLDMMDSLSSLDYDENSDENATCTTNATLEESAKPPVAVMQVDYPAPSTETAATPSSSSAPIPPPPPTPPCPRRRRKAAAAAAAAAPSSIPPPSLPPPPLCQQPQRKAVRFAVAANGRDLKTIIHRYSAATCPVTHHGMSSTSTISIIDDLDYAETRNRLCAQLYLSEAEILRIRTQQRQRAAMYATLTRMYVPCLDRLFDGRGFAPSATKQPKPKPGTKQKASKNSKIDKTSKSSPDTASSPEKTKKKKRPFTEKDAIRLITSASIRGLEYPCSIKMQGHRQWAKDRILACQDDCRQNRTHLHADEAAQRLADMCTRVSLRPKAFARKLAMGDARAAQEILMSQDVTTSRRELQLLSPKKKQGRGLDHHCKQQQTSKTNRKGDISISSSSSCCSSPQAHPQKHRQQQQKRPPSRDCSSF